jgi:hypothetical protein
VQIYKNICLIEQKAMTFNQIRVKLMIINDCRHKQNEKPFVLVKN